MSLSDEEQSRLKEIAEDILSALEDVATAAQRALSPTATSTDSLASPGNTMVGPSRGVQRLGEIRGETRRHVERVAREPFVSRVRVRWEDKDEETLFVTRGSAAGLGGDRKLASQATPKGRLAALDPGDTGTIAGREFEILERVELRPERREEWDALDDRIRVGKLSAAFNSLRAFLGSEAPDDVLGAILGAAQEQAAVREKLVRHVIARMALRDQPTLDRHQDEVSRLPLADRVLLLGPPGSGKTTTLIRRLAHKRHPEGLTEEERATLDATGLLRAYELPTAWVMFSPTDLLQLYLRDAFNREQVPAENRNLRTWDRERKDLGRNVLGILRTEADGAGFALEERDRLVKDESSKALAALYDAFLRYANGRVAERASRALDDLLESNDPGVSAATAQLSRRLERPDGILTLRDIGLLLDIGALLTPETTRIRKGVDDEVRRVANAVIGKQDSLVMRDMIAALPKLRTGAISEDDGADDDDDDDDEEARNDSPARTPEQEVATILLNGLRMRARQLATGRAKRPSARLALLIDVLGPKMPTESTLLSIGKKLLLLRDMRAVQRAPREFVMGLPKLYGRFRRTNEGAQWFLDTSTRGRSISAAEVDILILAMLGAARRLADLDQRRYAGTVPNWLDTIHRRYVPQVLVDEATDFSAVQLAGMIELAHPRLRSWFACGDFRQRITACGLQDAAELAWIGTTTGLREAVRSRDVSVGYRQSPRLRAFASALEGFQGQAPSTAAAPMGADFDSDVWPLLSERRAGSDLAKWIGARINEIGKAVKPLPSIAVFVDGEDRIDHLVKSLAAVLASQSLSVAACRNGRDIGDRQEVRVFDVQHIKGLEFEAVFFVGVDNLAIRLPDLFDRYLYVGVTRAATYLAVTCEDVLPAELEPARSLFSVGTWE